MELSSPVLEHFHHPRNVGSLDAGSPDVGTGQVGSPASGDVVRIQLLIAGGRIAEARFKTFGCASAIAASSLVTEMVTGRSLEEARRIDGAEIARQLTLPATKLHCGVYAERAVRAAIEDWLDKSKQQQPG